MTLIVLYISYIYVNPQIILHLRSDNRLCFPFCASLAIQVDIFSYAMFIFELLTGQRPYESLTTTQELNQAVIKGERPLVNEGNAEPSFPGLIDLMYDCWKHSSSDRPDADEVCVLVILTCNYGCTFMCGPYNYTRIVKKKKTSRES